MILLFKCCGLPKTLQIRHKLNVAEFIDVKGWKSLGNKLSDSKLISVRGTHKEEEVVEEEIAKVKEGDTVAKEDDNQPKLF